MHRLLAVLSVLLFSFGCPAPNPGPGGGGGGGGGGAEGGGGGGGAGADAGQAVPANIVALSPQHGEADVALSTVITVEFDAEMAAASIDATSFSVQGVAGVVSYDAASRTATYTPSAPLSPGATYAVTLAPSIATAEGVTLRERFTWAFTTRAPVKVTRTTPADGASAVQPGTSVSIVFSADVQASSVTASTVSIVGVAGATGYDAAERTATFTPSAPLALATTYVVRVLGVRDADGQPVAPHDSYFVTVGDAVAPTVTAVTPADGSAAVAASTALTATFSEPLDALTASAAAFSVTAASTPVSGAVSLSSDRKTLSFLPNAPLPLGAQVQAALETSIKDLAGNALAARHTWGFTTVADQQAPSVVAVTPPDLAAGVARQATLTAVFDEPMAAGTIDSTSFTVSGGVTGTVSFDAPSRTATFTPSAPLPFGATLTATLGTAIEDAAGNPLTAAYSWSFTVEPAPDTTPPGVTAISPPDGGTNVSYLLSAVQATFDEPMDPATINTATFLLVAGGPLVSGSVAYDAQSRTATFTPAAPLRFSQTYTAIVTRGAQDVAGNALPANASWSFTTEPDTYAPTIVSLSPPDGGVDIARNGSVSVVFSEEMKPASMPSYGTITLSAAGGGWAASGPSTYDAATRTLTLTPPSSMPWDAEVTATVAGTVADLAGNTLGANHTWTFRTEKDLVPPSVVAHAPDAGLQDVPADTTIEVTFSERMDLTTFTAANFTLSTGGTGTVSASTYQKVVFKPSTWLPAATQVTFTVGTGVKDAQGNPLASAYSFSFTTAADVTPPTIASRQPIPGARLVSPATKIQVKFSEPMKASTITDATFSVSGVSGAVAYDPATWTATFTPSSALPAGTTPTVTLSTQIQDAEGNALAAPSTWSFRVVNAPIAFTGDTAPVHGGRQFAFAPSGDGVAVWTITGGYVNPLGGAVVASSYSASTGTWSAEAVIHEYADGAVSLPSVATNGTTFLAAWAGSSDGVLRAASFTPGAGWSAAEVVASAANWFGPKVVSDGATYAALQYGKVYVRNAANDWSALTVSTEADLAGAAAAFAVVYVERAGSQDVVRARRWGSGQWGAAVDLSGTSGSASFDVSGLQLVSNGTGFGGVYAGYTVGYGYSSNGITVFTWDGNAWARSGPDTSGSAYLSQPTIAAGAAGYIVGYEDWTPTNPSVRGPRVSTWTGSGWTAHWLEPGGSGGAGVSANDTGFAASYGSNRFAVKVGATWGTGTAGPAGFTGGTLVGAGAKHSSLYVRADGSVGLWQHDGAGWADSTLQAASGVPARSALLARDAAAGYVASWTRGGAVYFARQQAAWSTPANPVTGAWRGDALLPSVAVAPSGAALVVWTQYDSGAAGVWARAYDGASWAAPVQLSTLGSNPAVATNGTTFVVAWPEGSSTRSLRARRYTPSSGTWDAAVQVRASTSNQTPLLSANPSGYLLMTGLSSYQWNTSSDGSTWSADATFSPNTQRGRLLTNGTTFTFLGTSYGYSSGDYLYAWELSAGAWSSSTYLASVQNFGAAAHGGDYIVVYSNGSAGTSARVHTPAGAWGAASVLSTGYASYDVAPAVASNGSTAFALYQDSYSELGARTYGGGQWTAKSPVKAPAIGVWAGTTTEFCGVALTTDGAGQSLVSQCSVGGAFGGSGGFIEPHAGALAWLSFTGGGDQYAFSYARANTTLHAYEVWGSFGN